MSTAQDGIEALQKARNEPPDLVVLDIMMPRMDGLEVCRQFREDPRLQSTPILMLTAKTEVEDEIKGLEEGADDYLAKPVSVPLFLSRIRALLRTGSRQHERPERLRAHDLVIDRGRFRVEQSNDEGEKKYVNLPRKEFEVLYLLASEPGRVFTRNEILDDVWGEDVYVVDRTVDVRIRNIRKELGSEYIETVKGVGYRFVEEEVGGEEFSARG